MSLVCHVKPQALVVAMTSEVLSSTRYAQIPQLYDILQISAKA